MDPITAITTLGAEVIKASDDWFTTDEERAEANRAAYQAQVAAALAQAQMQISAYEAEAKSGHRGWRHQVGTVLACAFGLHFLIFPLFTVFLPFLGVEVPIPQIEIETLMPIMLGMLGLGGIRAYDLKQGTRK